MILRLLVLASCLGAARFTHEPYPPIERMDHDKIYKCRYYKEIGFLKYFEVENVWQCIPCFAAMDPEEVEACWEFGYESHRRKK